MNDRFNNKDGARFSTSEMQRVQRRFRHHVRTPSNPRGRIHREGCFWHPEIEGEAHHIDYARPFVVVWACPGNDGCHRKIERGGLNVPKNAVHDYTSLVEWRAVQHLRRVGPVVGSKACTCGRKRKKDPHKSGCPRWGEEIPF